MTDATAPKGAKSRTTAAKASLDQVVDKAADAVGDARQWAEEQSDAVRTFARERPVAAIGISAGAAFLGGLLVGFLVGRAID
jgi:ElaB/YqjD/DUF883 family membrane-anchored ribosome-binding protein